MSIVIDRQVGKPMACDWLVFRIAEDRWGAQLDIEYSISRIEGEP
jgi:hypothetical protein